MPSWIRPPLALTALVTLLFGLLIGEIRLGWEGPAWAADLALVHGPLMVCGFFGTVIALERAVALNTAWVWSAPAGTAAGAVAILMGTPLVGTALFGVGSAVFAAANLVVLKRQPALFTAVMALGALLWVAGIGLWIGDAPFPVVALLWAGFLVLTIIGERVELSRFLKPRPGRGPALLPALALSIAGPIAMLAGWDEGRLVGLAWITAAAWLLRYDIALQTVRRSGVTRYMAVCLLSGYAWLLIAGALALTFGLPPAGPLYDAVLHALFVGFVFSMVFGHAPVILPAVLGGSSPYTPALYGLLVLLHGSLALRVAGNLLGRHDAVLWGGLANGVTIVAFLAVMMVRVVLLPRLARGLSASHMNKPPKSMT